MHLANAARAGLQSASIMTLADVATQFGIEGRSIEGGHQHHTTFRSYDPMRTFRWASIGLTLHGPYFFYAMARLDRHFGAAVALPTVLKKTAVAQFIVFPPYLVGLFAYMGALEGSSDIVEKVRNRVPEAFMGGCAFWPAANVVNFAFISPAVRVPYLAAVGGVWNAFLSWLNARNEDPNSCAATDSSRPGFS